MAQYDELIGVLRILLTDRFAPKPRYINGLLGDGRGNVEVPGYPDRVYARFSKESTTYFEIFNVTVPKVNNWPVKIGELPWNPGLTQVVGTNWSAFEQAGWGDILGSTSPHAPTHEWPDGSPGSDAVDVHLRAIVPGRAFISDSAPTVIYVNSFEYGTTGTLWAGLPGVDLQPMMSATVTGTMRYAGVYVDESTNSLGIVTGGTTVYTSALEPPRVSFPETGVIPIARVRVYGGQAGLVEADIKDARRPWDSGGGSSGAPTDAQYVTMALNGTLSAERVLTAGTGIGLADGGAGNTVTVSVDNTEQQSGTITVTNTSGNATVTGDVGYIDSAGEYKETTTFGLEAVNWCVVVTGGANNTDIEVARSGLRAVRFAGTTPTVGYYVYTSTTSGLAEDMVVVWPGMFGIIKDNTGWVSAGDTCQVLLHCNRVPVKTTSANSFFRVNNTTGSSFSSTINGAPSGTSVVYNAPTGNEDSIVPAASTELAKLVLHNTTRGNYALISSVNTGTNTITVTDAADIATWQSGDSIQVNSQDVTGTSFGSSLVFDLLITSSVIPKLATALLLDMAYADTGAPGATTQGFVHPFEGGAFSSNKAVYISSVVTVIASRRSATVPVYSQRIGVCWGASGAGTGTIVLRLSGFDVAAP